jgi:hypothetical protein
MKNASHSSLFYTGSISDFVIEKKEKLTPPSLPLDKGRSEEGLPLPPPFDRRARLPSVGQGYRGG